MTPTLLPSLLPAMQPARGAASHPSAEDSAPADFAASLELVLRTLAEPGSIPAETAPAGTGDEPADALQTQPDALALLLSGLPVTDPVRWQAAPLAPAGAAPTPAAANASLLHPALDAAQAGDDLRAASAGARTSSTFAEAFTDEVVSLRAAAVTDARSAPAAVQGVAVGPFLVAAHGPASAGALAPAAGFAGPAELHGAAAPLAAGAGPAPAGAAALQPEVAPPDGGMTGQPTEPAGGPLQPSASVLALRTQALDAIERAGDESSDAAPAPAPANAAAAVAGPAAAAAAPSLTHAAPPPTSAQLPVPVGSSEWGAALGRQLVRLGPQRELELHLNPAELGPLQVKLSLGERQAQVTFVSEHAAVRQALEAALPQLRSSFADSGISLGQATVGSGAGESAAQQGAGQHAAPRREREPQGAEHGSGRPERGEPVRGGSGRAVDTFA